MPHVLRAISGPQAGAVYVLGKRTLIGRASDCDIQILHEGVSRHHARISREPDGTVVVVDLASDNGTLVEGERVERHVLVEGQELCVVRARFVFELHQEADAVTSEVFQRKITSGVSLRQTVPYEREPAASRQARITPRRDGTAGEHDFGGTYAEGRRRRDRITAMPASWLRGKGTASPTTSPTTRGAEPSHRHGGQRDDHGEHRGPAAGSPSGRMAPAAPTGVGADAEPHAADSGDSSASLAAGWVRIPRPQVAECGMRPGTTLGGSPPLDEPTSRDTAMMPGVAAPVPSPGVSPRGLHSPTPIAYEDTMHIGVDEGERAEGEPDEDEPTVRSPS